MGFEQGQVTIGRLPEKADVVIPVATGISLFLLHIIGFPGFFEFVIKVESDLV